MNWSMVMACAAVCASAANGQVAFAQQTVATAESSHTRPREDVSSRLVSIDVTQVSRAQAVDAIAAKAKVLVQYRVQVLNADAKLVTIHLNKVPLRTALEQALVGTNLRVIPDGPVQLAIVRALEDSARGAIEGVVIDDGTKQPIRDARIMLDGKARGVASGPEGKYYIGRVPAGVHTVTVKRLGFGHQVRQVTVGDEETVQVDWALTPGTTALDQVIVTGTVLPTKLREVPNAMTVITAKQIEERGITHIDQLFRGDVPGLFSQNLGSANQLGQTTMFSRGATNIETHDPVSGIQSNPIKTYVDGVEMADPHFLSQIDPRSIERVEILTGPQASTIYGSNALNGVMQIFTKRGGGTNRPQFTATLLSGTLQNDFSNGLAPQHDYSAQVSGTEGHVSYNAGGTWNYIGRWTPAVQQNSLSGFAGARFQHGPVTVDGSLRMARLRDLNRGAVDQYFTQGQTEGLYTIYGAIGGVNFTNVTGTTQTSGVTLGYVPFPGWSHEVVLGRDEAETETRSTRLGYRNPSDSSFFVSQGNNYRTSVRYSTVARIPVTQQSQLVVTAGADSWNSTSTQILAIGSKLSGPINGYTSLTRQPGRNSGGFLQTQFSIADALFFTYGLRAEWNPDYGDEAQPNLAPKFGVAYARDFGTRWGQFTAKLRGTYGRSTRPPISEQKDGFRIAERDPQSRDIPYYGNVYDRLPNPLLGPETQRGGEAGLELYFGNRSSLVVTRYNQTVNNLVLTIYGADSARSLAPFPNCREIPQCTSVDAEGYGYIGMSQNINAADIRNQGWELQGTMSVGPLTTRGTYSWTTSRLIGVTQQYRRLYVGRLDFVNGLSFQHFPEHTWAFATTYSRGRSNVTLNVNGIGQVSSSDPTKAWTEMASYNLRLSENRARADFYKPPYFITGAYVTGDLNVAHQFSRMIEGILQVQNISNVYHSDANPFYASLGRQTKAGARIRL